MPANHAAAILRWRETIDKQGGLAEASSATISTMLFGCRRYLDTHAAAAPKDEVERISAVEAELVAWLEARGLTFTS